MDPSGEAHRGVDVVGHAVLFAATAGLVGALTLIFRSARSVMEIGGSCASGGPYVAATPCPKGVPWLLVGSIWGGLALALVVSVSASRVGAPEVAWLAWPGLFLSLGWNFWEFGLDPPSGDGVVWGWIVCGAMFVAMGAAPVLLAAVSSEGRAPSGSVARATALGTRVRATTTPPPFRPGPGLVDELERLDALHRSGGLTDEEHAAAKRVLLGGGR
ncbi:MAG: SHOCT domain-containing protein [Acidimicrobiales bacterium]|nr:SHOCT domain-containing protein [Actinomycetota bacterium]